MIRVGALLCSRNEQADLTTLHISKNVLLFYCLVSNEEFLLK